MTLALSHRRIGVLLLLFGLLLTLGLARALQLTTVDSAHLSSLAEAEHAATIVVPAARGNIVDRNGTILATTEPASDVSATPALVHDQGAFAAELAPILGVSPGLIEEKLAHPTSGPGYTLIARHVPAAIVAQVKALKLPGVAFAADPRRVYPDGALAAQVLGGVSLSGSPIGGVELQENAALAGTAGVQHAVFDAHGTAIAAHGTTPVGGKTVQLTIDAAIQEDAENVLKATALKYRPLHESVIVMDPQTNAILADANWPRINANYMGVSTNYASQFDYEPGSTFKVVAIGGALAEGLITPNTHFTIPDSYHVSDRIIHDSDYHPTETLSVAQILAHSSNIGAVKIGQRLLASGAPGSNPMYDWIRRYGFGSPTGVDLPGEEPGIVPAPQNWSGSSIGNLPIGQGELVTPLQMATAYAAIANGGILRPPHVIASVGGAPTAEPAGHRIFSTHVSDELRGMLEGVFGPTGTASEISIPGYQLAGKTGTANKVVNGTYSNTDYFASFVGFAPASDPKIEAIVLVDQPSNGFVYGTEVAAPAWQQIMNFALPYLKIAPS